jgi:hypothetical protein
MRKTVLGRRLQTLSAAKPTLTIFAVSAYATRWFTGSHAFKQLRPFDGQPQLDGRGPLRALIVTCDHFAMHAL